MALLMLTAGRGPAECRLAVHGLRDRLLQEAAEAGVAADVVAEVEDRERKNALLSAVLNLEGEGVTALLARWEGTLEWKQRSPLRPTHGRKRWFVGCFRLPDPEDVPGLDPKDIRFETMRAGGAGGQHVNKTESAVRAVHLPTGLTVLSRTERSQHRNRAKAIEWLRSLVADRAEDQRSAAQGKVRDLHDRLERGQAKRTFRGERFS